MSYHLAVQKQGYGQTCFGWNTEIGDQSHNEKPGLHRYYRKIMIHNFELRLCINTIDS